MNLNKMPQKTQAKINFNYVFIDLFDSMSKYLPYFMHDWIKNRARRFRNANGQVRTKSWLTKRINEDKKYLRWTCAICGAFIKEVNDWPSIDYISNDCKVGHFNQIFVEKKGHLVFKALIPNYSEEDIDKILKDRKNPKS